ncbi:RNA polymerase sigma factor [soil metagenome]
METLSVNDLRHVQQNQGIASVISAYGRRLNSFIRQRVATNEDAEDILHDVYIDLTETMRVQPIEQMAAWLFRVARNKIIDRYRKHKPVLFEDLNTSRLEDDEDRSFIEDLLGAEDDPGFRSVDNELIREALLDALEELPEEQREVFIRHEIEQQSFKEISDDLKVSVNTLLSRKHYAVKFLRTKLSSLYGEMFNK